MARYIEELEYMICDELDKIAQQGELNAGSLDTVQKLTHSLKSLKTIDAMDGYSHSSYPSGYSQKRDSMGRYSRGYRGYSREGEKDHMMKKIEELRQTVENMNE